MLPTLVVACLALPFVPGESPRIASCAGTGDAGYDGDGGPAIKARLNGPFGVALDRDGSLYFSDTGNHCIRRVDSKSGIITTVVGCGRKGFAGDGGPAAKAQLNEPYGIAIDRAGNLFIVDRLNSRIRRVDGKSGAISTLAGTGERGFGGDGGPAVAARMREPNGIALDEKGKLYIADVSDQRVRVVDLKSGLIDTLCGNGKKAHTGDGGPFAAASLLGPRAVAVGPDGSLFICEREGHCVRRIDFSTGKIERFAGTGEKGYSGDGGPAVDARFDGPKEIAVDRQGNLFVVDTENHVIRLVDGKTRVITTAAGTGKAGGTGDDGPPARAQLNRPHGVCVGADGALYIGDTQNHRVRIVR